MSVRSLEFLRNDLIGCETLLKLNASKLQCVSAIDDGRYRTAFTNAVGWVIFGQFSCGAQTARKSICSYITNAGTIDATGFSLDITTDNKLVVGLMYGSANAATTVPLNVSVLTNNASTSYVLAYNTVTSTFSISVYGLPAVHVAANATTAFIAATAGVFSLGVETGTGGYLNDMVGAHAVLSGFAISERQRFALVKEGNSIPAELYPHVDAHLLLDRRGYKMWDCVRNYNVFKSTPVASNLHASLIRFSDADVGQIDETTQTVYYDFYTKALYKWWKVDGSNLPVLYNSKLLISNRTNIPEVQLGLRMYAPRKVEFEYNEAVKTGLIEAIVYPEDVTGLNVIVSFITGATAAHQTRLYIEGGFVYFQCRAVSSTLRTIRTTSAISANRLYVIQVMQTDPANSMAGYRILINGVSWAITYVDNPALSAANAATVLMIGAGSNLSTIGARYIVNAGNNSIDTTSFFKGVIFAVGVRNDGGVPAFLRRSIRHAANGLTRTDSLNNWWIPSQVMDAIPDTLGYNGTFGGTGFANTPTDPSKFTLAIKYRVPANYVATQGYIATIGSVGANFINILHEANGSMRVWFRRPAGMANNNSGALYFIANAGFIQPGLDFTLALAFDNTTCTTYLQGGRSQGTNSGVKTFLTQDGSGNYTVPTPIVWDSTAQGFHPNAPGNTGNGASVLEMSYAAIMDGTLNDAQVAAIHNDHTVLRTHNIFAGFWYRDKINGNCVNRLFLIEDVAANNINTSGTVMGTTNDNLDPANPSYALVKINDLR